MSRLNIITFLSDFGWAGGYVAACEANIASICPDARVCHISHDIAVGDIAAGSLALERVAPFFPASIHLGVVDPGVGTARHPLALATARGDRLVGPDNGLLMAAADALGGLTAAWQLDADRVCKAARLPADKVSSTFHGRDIFAPAAAILAGTGDPALLGSVLDPATLVRLPPPIVEVMEDAAVAEVIEVDRFGNVALALRFVDFRPRQEELIVDIVGEDVPDWNARVVHTFGELRPGELGVFCDSWGHVALALNSASAAQLLTLERGMTVRLTSVEASSAFDPLR